MGKEGVKISFAVSSRARPRITYPTGNFSYKLGHYSEQQDPRMHSYQHSVIFHYPYRKAVLHDAATCTQESVPQNVRR